MAQASGKSVNAEVGIIYREESTAEEDFANGERRRRPSTWALVSLGVIILLSGIGGGFGIGWVARKASEEDSYEQPLPAPTAILDNIDRLLPLRPLAVLGEASNDAVRESEEQWQLMLPALRCFGALISAMANESVVVEARVLRAYLASLPDGPSSAALRASVYGVSQRLLVNPAVPRRLYDVTASMVRLFRWARAAQDRYYTGGGVRRMAEQQRLEGQPQQNVELQQELRQQEQQQQQQHHRHRRRGRQLQQGSISNGGANAAIYSMMYDGLNHPSLQDVRQTLLELYELDPLQDLMVSVWLSLRGLAAALPALKELAAAAHPDPKRVVLGVTQEVLVAAGGAPWGGGAPMTVLPDLPPIVGLVEQESNGSALLTDQVQQRLGRRRLAAGVAVVPPLPDGFTPKAAADVPALLLPLVFHIMLYRAPDGVLGPPGYESALEQASRLVSVANTLAAPAGMQMFVREVRNDPARWPYLLAHGANRSTWLSCAADSAFAYELCGGVIRSAAADFPRSINVFVISEGPPAKYFGYAFGSGSARDPLYGHIGLIYSTISTAGLNGQSSYETGAVTLWHEVMHHLGLRHTFSSDGSCSEQVADDLADTPVTTGPVWAQPWAMDAYLACMQSVQYDMRNDWGRIYAAWRTTLGIPPGDQRSFAQSCPGRPGQDELGNYLTYTYDVCYAAFGHATPQQVRSMHASASTDNPSLYGWAQYYAANPPPEAKQGALAAMFAPPPPPPPLPPPPPSGGNGGDASAGMRTCPPQYTRTLCRCKDTWAYLGVSYKGCTTVPGEDRGGAWCGVIKEDGCTGARNGWWDMCTPVQSMGCKPAAVPSSPPPPPPPPPPSPRPPPPSANAAVACGAGAPTRQGFTCAAGRWTTGATRYSGCANPNSGPDGVWCALPKGVTTPSGASWDLCLPACNNGRSAATPSPSPSQSLSPGAIIQGCTTTAQSLPAGCTCLKAWTSTVGNTTSVNAGCTLFPAADPRPVCAVDGCISRRNNNKVVTCSCPST